MDLRNTPLTNKGVDHWDNFSIRVSTPEGNATIIITESKSGVVENIFYMIGKQGSSLNAWAYAFAQQTLNSIKFKGLASTISDLEGITSDRSPRDPTVLHSMSGPEALCIALKEYRKTFNQPEPNAEYYRPPSIGFRNAEVGYDIVE